MPRLDEVQVYLGADAGGHYVEWYTDDDGGSGYGDNAAVCRWYGGRANGAARCAARAALPPPRCGWSPIADRSCPPYDAASNTGMYDRI